MKTRLLILSMLLFTAIQVKANHSKAVFKTTNGTKMIVFLDGNRLNAKPMQVVSLDKVYPGRHQVKIKLFNGHRQREFIQPVDFKVHHKAVFQVDRMGRRQALRLVKTVEEPMFARPYRPYNGGNQGRIVKGHGKYNHYQMLNMHRFMKDMQYQRFDPERLEFAKLAITHKMLYAEDLRMILNTLSFDSKKLELAQFAYANVIDKENIYVTYDAFTFNSSVRKFQRYTHGDSWF